MAAIRVGDPQDASIEMGPVINENNTIKFKNLLKLVLKKAQH